MDLSWGMLAADRSGQPVAQADGAALPVADGAVDGVTCGYALRNFTELGAVFAELGRVVRPGGRISLLEVAEPESGLLLAGHRIWFRRVVPVIGGLVSDGAAYRYLPKSTAYLPPTAELRSMLDRGRVLGGQPPGPVRRPEPVDHRHPRGSAVTGVARRLAAVRLPLDPGPPDRPLRPGRADRHPVPRRGPGPGRPRARP